MSVVRHHNIPMFSNNHTVDDLPATRWCIIIIIMIIINVLFENNCIINLTNNK